MVCENCYWKELRSVTNLRKGLYITAGILCVILGFIGILVPVLPTTPFLLLAAFLFTRSSQRALHWLETNRLFGAYIQNYRTGRGMRLRDKVFTISFLWLAILGSIFSVIESLWLKIILFCIASAVTVHLLRIRTYR